MNSTTTKRKSLWIALTAGSVFLGFLAVILIVSSRISPSETIEVPREAERRWAELLMPLYRGEPDSSLECRDLLQGMADSLLSNQEWPPQVEVHLSARPMVNAVTLPDDQVILYRGLLNDVESENELTMILAHELGHVLEGHSREYFRRRMVLTFAGGALSQFPILGPILVQLAELHELRHSRESEAEADSIGLELLVGYYGHAAGATGFFERRLEEEGDAGDALEFLLTHPLSRKRIDAIEEQMERQGYEVRSAVALEPTCISRRELEWSQDP